MCTFGAPGGGPPDSDVHEGGGQRHEVFVYHEPDEYVTFLCTFVREGLEAGEQALVALPGDRLGARVRQVGSQRHLPRRGGPGGSPPDHGAAATDPVPEFRFGRHGLDRLRRFIQDQAGGAGIDPDRTAELVLAANEIATNTVTHGGSDGTARCWTDDGTLVCELAGPGTVGDPMAGRVRPDPTRPSGRGLWLANQLCDLVELTNTGEGTVTRLHLRNAVT